MGFGGQTDTEIEMEPIDLCRKFTMKLMRLSIIFIEIHQTSDINGNRNF